MNTMSPAATSGSRLRCLFALAAEEVQYLLAVGMGVSLVALPGFEQHDAGAEPLGAGDLGGVHPLQRAPV